MNNTNKICDVCGEPLKPSQFLRENPEGQPAIRSEENLVCRNYPKCPKAEKESGK
jgi:hypothetical protein